MVLVRARVDTKTMRGDERDKYRRYTPYSHALGRACTHRLAPETTGRVLAKTKTKTNPSPPTHTTSPPNPQAQI